MIHYIDITKAKYKTFLAKEEDVEGKKWSYSYVYFLEDLKLIFNILSKNEFSTLHQLLNFCESFNIISKSGKIWTKRSLLEVVNALRNFHLISLNTYKPMNQIVFSDNENTLSEPDRNIFKEIYCNYIRFTEFHRLFLPSNSSISLENLEKKSHPIISFSDSGRFTNCFMSNNETNNNIITKIDAEYSEIMRFWDVYIKWGWTLGLLEKYPLKPFSISLNPTQKNSSIVYFPQKMPTSFSVFSYIDNEMKAKFVYIPNVIYNIIAQYRYPLYDIKEKLIYECMHDEDYFRAQSASAIFIKEYEKLLIPKLGNTYVTHLLKIR
nr:MAG TPA: hypothetical protein [Caudoviricetes sp.]